MHAGSNGGHWVWYAIYVPVVIPYQSLGGGGCDIHCKFLSTIRGRVLPNESMCIIFMLCVALCWTYISVKLCIVSVLNGILSVSYFVFVSCMNFITFQNQYTDSIV